MADTGAPWNLPYPLSTDLVRDGADAIKDLAEATATGLSLAGNEGIGPNVVQTVKTDTFSTTSTSFGTVTGLTATITPSSATAKVLVICNYAQGISANNDRFTHFRLVADDEPVFVGDADGSRLQAADGNYRDAGDYNTAESILRSSIVFVHAPETAAPVTYALQARIASAGVTAFVNRSGRDTNSTNFARYASSITLIEVAA